MLHEEFVQKDHVSMLQGRPERTLRGLGHHTPFGHRALGVEWFRFGILFSPADIPR